MRFEWDEEKSRRCYLERGISFDATTAAFRDPARIAEIDD